MLQGFTVVQVFRTGFHGVLFLPCFTCVSFFQWFGRSLVCFKGFFRRFFRDGLKEVFGFLGFSEFWVWFRAYGLSKFLEFIGFFFSV